MAVIVVLSGRRKCILGLRISFLGYARMQFSHWWGGGQGRPEEEGPSDLILNILSGKN